MLLRLTRQFSFQMAHALDQYDGKCRNIHGHNYKLFVTVEGQPASQRQGNGSEEGMVIDFGRLREIVDAAVVSRYDHAFVVREGSPFEAIEGTKKLVVPFQPTCENLLLDFASKLDGLFPEGVRLQSLRLYETDNSCAELIL